jgi:hypothetical protein
MALLFGAGVAVGLAAHHYAFHRWEDRLLGVVVVAPNEAPSAEPVRPPASPVPFEPLRPMTLSGPGGTVRLPPRALAGDEPGPPAIVNLWPTPCSDCDRAFAAYQAFADKMLADFQTRGVKVPVINVTNGPVDPAWAASRRVGDSLVYDPDGAKLLRPLDIVTFTTLVVDAKGYVRLVDHPESYGYGDRLLGATRALSSGFWLGEPVGDPVKSAAARF